MASVVSDDNRNCWMHLPDGIDAPKQEVVTNEGGDTDRDVGDVFAHVPPSPLAEATSPAEYRADLGTAATSSGRCANRHIVLPADPQAGREPSLVRLEKRLPSSAG